MITYPIKFEASAESLSGMNVPWNITASSFDASCSVPESFDGPGGTFSPEDFFMMSLQNCFVATFKVFAEYSRLTYSTLKVDAQLIVNKDDSGKPWMETVNLKIKIQGVEDTKKAHLLVKKTLENGFILRSVKSEIISEVEIN